MIESSWQHQTQKYLFYNFCFLEILKQKKPDFHDTTGKTRYIQVCSDMGIRPVSYFVKNLEQKELKLRFHGLDLGQCQSNIDTVTGKELKLRFHGLDLDSVKAISIPLQVRHSSFGSMASIWTVSKAISIPLQVRHSSFGSMASIWTVSKQYRYRYR